MSHPFIHLTTPIHSPKKYRLTTLIIYCRALSELPCTEVQLAHQRPAKICSICPTICSNASLWEKIFEEVETWRPLSTYINLIVLKSIFNHSWNDASQQWTGQFKTWIGVYFDEPYIEVVVYHEVHP